MRLPILLLLLLLLLVVPALALPDPSYEDDTHPRSPGTPLNVVWRPFKVTLGPGLKKPTKAKYAENESFEEEIRMMRMPVAEMAKAVGAGKKWVAIETPHFKLFSNLRSTKVKPKDSRFLVADLWRLKEIFPSIAPAAMVTVLTPLQRAHLYQIRIERIYAHFAALMGADKTTTGKGKRNLGMGGKYQLFLFENYTEHHNLCDKFTGRVNDKAGLQHHMRDDPNFMMYTQAASQIQGGDVALANNVIHNVAHNLVDGYGNYYRETWAFLEEGLGHYYERRENPKHNTFCWAEGAKPADFQKEKWEGSILNIVRRKKDPPLSQWCEKLQPGELGGIEQGLCWSIVRWMIETDPIRFAKLVEKLQDYANKPGAAESIEFAFGVSVSTLHARWREYVLAEYGKKK